MTRLFTHSLLFSSVLLTACISYQPTVLTPAITLSPEDISLAAGLDSSASQDFGLDVSLNESDSLSNVEILPGVRVRNLSANGPADSAGIQVGDIILSVNEMDTNHPDVLTALQQQSTAGREFAFIIRRNTVVFEATVIPRTISSTSPPVELYRSDPIATRAAYRTELITIRNQPDRVAARLVELYPQSPLRQAGLSEGALILAIDGVYINSAQDLINRVTRDYAPGAQITMSIYDGQAIAETRVKLWDAGRRISRLSLGPLLQYTSSLNPSSNNLSILDFWLFSVYSYSRNGDERSHSFLGLFNFTSDYGELREETN